MRLANVILRAAWSKQLPHGLNLGVDDFRAVQALGRGFGLPVRPENCRKSVTAPALRPIDTPVRADHIMMKRLDARRQTVPEPVGGMLFIDPGNRIQEGPQFL